MFYKEQRMKKLICFTICLVFFGGIPVYANSAPSYWKAYPYSDILAVEQNSPVTVERERLTFDFTQVYDDGGYHSPAAKVLAEYQIENPTDDPLFVQMAFPFVESLSTLSPNDITVTADGSAVPFKIYIDPQRPDASGDPDESFSYDYGSIGNITNQEIKLSGFNLDSDAKLYRFAVSGKEEDNLYLQVGYRSDINKALLIGDGFHGLSYSGETGNQLDCRIRENTECEILVLGEEPQMSWDVVTGEGKRVDECLYQLNVNSDSANPKEYLLEALRGNISEDTIAISDDTLAAISNTQLINPCLNEIYKENQESGFAMISEVVSTICSDRIFTLIYQIEFPPKSVRSVNVGYIAKGTMDRRETVSPKYSYTYLLSPAENWADFGLLELQIITPQEAPYIIESSLSLTDDGENRYIANFDSLPESELIFTLYEKEQVTWIDKTEKTISQASYLLFFFWPVLIVILGVIAVFAGRAFIRKFRRTAKKPR